MIRTKRILIISAVPFQAVGSFALMLLGAMLLMESNIYTQEGWILSLALLWLAIWLPVFVIGSLFYTWRRLWKLPGWYIRLTLAGVGGIIPLIFLLLKGLPVLLTEAEAEFTRAILNDMQPKILLLSLVGAIIGHALPVWFTKKV